MLQIAGTSEHWTAPPTERRAEWNGMGWLYVVVDAGPGRTYSLSVFSRKGKGVRVDGCHTEHEQLAASPEGSGQRDGPFRWVLVRGRSAPSTADRSRPAAPASQFREHTLLPACLAEWLSSNLSGARAGQGGPGVRLFAVRRLRQHVARLQQPAAQSLADQDQPDSSSPPKSL